MQLANYAATSAEHHANLTASSISALALSSLCVLITVDWFCHAREHSLQMYADIRKESISCCRCCRLALLLLSCTYVGHERWDKQAPTLTTAERKGWTT